MTPVEVGLNIKSLNRQDLDVLRTAVEERHNALRADELKGLLKTVSIGTFASYTKAGAEIIGEVVSLNRKGVALSIKEGEETRRKSVAWGDIAKTYPTMPRPNPVPPKPAPKTEQAQPQPAK